MILSSYSVSCTARGGASERRRGSRVGGQSMLVIIVIGSSLVRVVLVLLLPLGVYVHAHLRGVIISTIRFPGEKR